ncbi:MAG: DinB family protein, partial [Chloroflexi bacterium]|nr:DinB family protein [Chloroflexota bacterium]
MSTFLTDTVDILRRTPAVVSALLAGVPNAWAETPDVPDGWRPRDVVGHLISAEIDDWIPRAERILADGTSKPFEAFDRFAHVERDSDVPLDRLVERFAELRAQMLARLDELVTDEADLDRRGLHPTLGEVTLRELLATWAVHDLDHVSQIFAGMAASQDAAVGPWKTYLGILLRRDDPAAMLGEEHSAKLRRLAERTHTNPGTIARFLLSTALDEAD